VTYSSKRESIEIELNSEHSEDEHEHKDAETFAAHKIWDGFVRREAADHSVV
jgi:hypothetical protein